MRGVNFKKYMLFLALFMLFICCVGVVSASEDCVVDDSNTLNLSENHVFKEDIEFGGSTFDELDSLIANSSDGDVIMLKGDISQDSSYHMTISKRITIDGRGYSIDAQGKSQIFNITADFVVLKNINFINGNSVVDGGAISWYGGDGRISDCKFINNTACGTGGAIMWSGANGRISDCNFEDNCVNGDVINTCGGAIAWSGANGRISGCYFANNTSKGKGGAISWYCADGEVYNCDFTHNTATNYGGAIYCYYGANANVLKCFFENNVARDGGAIYGHYSYNANVFNCNFVNNAPERYGGAIYWYYSANSTVYNCNFTNNSAKGYGGAINWDNSDNGRISYSCFSNNIVKGYGSAINFNHGKSIVSNCIFMLNKASSSVISCTNFDNLLTFTFLGCNNYINAIYSSDCEITFDDVVYYWNGEFVNSKFINPIFSDCECGINITLEIYSNGNLVKNLSLMTNSYGKVSFDYSKMDLGKYNYKVYHADDAYYNYAIKIGSFNVQEGSSVDVDDAVGFYGNPVVVSFNIPEGSNASGIETDSVKVYNRVSDEEVTGLNVTVNNSDKTITIVGLVVGDYVVNVTTVPVNDNYYPVVCSGNVRIVKASLMMPVSVESLVTYPEDVVVSILAPVNGTYQVKINNIVNSTYIVAGQMGNIIIADLNVSATYYNIEVTGVPDDLVSYEIMTNDTLDVIINPASSYVDVGDAVGVYGDIIVVSFNIPEGSNASGIETDSVKVYNRVSDEEVTGLNVTVNNSDKTITIVGLVVGDYVVNVTTVPVNDNYYPVVCSGNVRIVKASLMMPVSVESPVTYPEDVVVTVVAFVDGIYQVIIDDIVNSTHIVAGQFGKIIIAGLEDCVTLYDIEVVGYPDDFANYDVMTNNTLTVKVNKRGSGEDIINVNDTVYGEPVIVEINLPDDASGNVTVNIANSTVVQPVHGGKNYVQVENIPCGLHTVYVNYSGDDNHSPIWDVDEVQVIPKDFTLNVFDDDGHVEVLVPDDASGSVTISDDGVNFNEPIKNGKAIFDLPISSGAHNITITYSGDGNYDSVSINKTINISNATVRVVDMKRGYNSSYDFKAIFTYEDGSLLASRWVMFVVNGVRYSEFTDANGIAYLKLTLPVLNMADTDYVVEAYNLETGEHRSAVTTIVPRFIVMSGNLTADYLENPDYVVLVIGDDGEPVGAGETVRFVFAGFYYDIQTNETGHAVRSIGLAPGMYAVYATYKGQRTEQTVFMVYQTLKAGSGTIVKTDKSYTLEATLIHTNGVPLVGKEVTLRFNGKSYIVKTNKLGIATLTIKFSVINKLKVGKIYNLTARYVNDLTKGKSVGKIKVVKK